MKKILEYLVGEGSFLYEKAGYQISRTCKHGMGISELFLSKGDIEICLTQWEYGCVTLEFRKVGSENQQVPLEVIRWHLTGTLFSAEVNPDDRDAQFFQKMIEDVRCEEPQIEEKSDGHTVFLKSRLSEIEELLGDDQIERTIEQIDALRSKRADMLWGENQPDL